MHAEMGTNPAPMPKGRAAALPCQRAWEENSALSRSLHVSGCTTAKSVPGRVEERGNSLAQTNPAVPPAAHLSSWSGSEQFSSRLPWALLQPAPASQHPWHVGTTWQQRSGWTLDKRRGDTVNARCCGFPSWPPTMLQVEGRVKGFPHASYSLNTGQSSWDQEGLIPG